MLDRFTETAKKLVNEAKEIAESMHHSEIRNEHLLRAIVNHQGCHAWRMIVDTGTPYEVIDRELNAVLVPVSESISGSIAFNENIKKTIEKAYLQTESMGFTWISSTLILLGINESGSPVSRKLLTSWGLDSEHLLERIKAAGDLPGSEEKAEPLLEFDLKIYTLSRLFNEDARNVLQHAFQLAKTYHNTTLNIHHVFLSLAFLSSRGVIDLHPLDPAQLNVERIKKFVADKLGDGGETDEEMVYFSSDVVDLLKIAVLEAFQSSSEFVGAFHILTGLLADHPLLFRETTDLTYYGLRYQLIEETKMPDQQTTAKTTPIVNSGKHAYPRISLRRYNADPGAVITIPQKLAEEWQAVALSVHDNMITVAMRNPSDKSIIKKIRELSGMDVSIIQVDENDLKSAFKMYY